MRPNSADKTDLLTPMPVGGCDMPDVTWAERANSGWQLIYASRRRGIKGLGLTRTMRKNLAH